MKVEVEIDEATKQRLEEAAEVMGITFEEAFRKAIEFGLAEREKELSSTKPEGPIYG
jgi:antitoxin component of RelBE/YafQ-DinJ toxin-antitoxin module